MGQQTANSLAASQSKNQHSRRPHPGATGRQFARKYVGLPMRHTPHGQILGPQSISHGGIRSWMHTSSTRHCDAGHAAAARSWGLTSPRSLGSAASRRAAHERSTRRKRTARTGRSQRHARHNPRPLRAPDGVAPSRTTAALRSIAARPLPVRRALTAACAALAPVSQGSAAKAAPAATRHPSEQPTPAWPAQTAHPVPPERAALPMESAATVWFS